MAIIKLNYLSKALLRTVDVTVVLPTDTLDMDTMTYNQKKEYKTLYLLHGIFGDQNDWLYGTRIQRFASERGLCVVMPSGEICSTLIKKIRIIYTVNLLGKNLQK